LAIFNTCPSPIRKFWSRSLGSAVAAPSTPNRRAASRAASTSVKRGAVRTVISTLLLRIRCFHGFGHVLLKHLLNFRQHRRKVALNDFASPCHEFRRFRDHLLSALRPIERKEVIELFLRVSVQV